MNKPISLFIIILLCILFTGCWNYKEVNDIFIVAGISIDKDPGNKRFIVSAEVINVNEATKENTIESQRVESNGDAVFEAVRNMIKLSAKKLYWSHATSIIISESVARESILPVLDWVVRDIEPRLGMNVYISKENSAKELLDSESIATVIRSYELTIMADKNKDLIEIPMIEVHELLNKLAAPMTHPVIPAIEVVSNQGKATNLLSGTAVFNKDKLAGYLNVDDMLPYLFLTNNVNGGLLEVKSNDDLKETIVLEIFRSKTKITPKYTGNSVDFAIDIKTDVTIGEMDTPRDFISKSGRTELKKLAEESLKKDLENIFRKVQREFGLDIFGFGDIVRQKDPDTWKAIEKDWNSIFEEIDITINCDINIKNSGQFIKPVEVHE